MLSTACEMEGDSDLLRQITAVNHALLQDIVHGGMFANVPHRLYRMRIVSAVVRFVCGLLARWTSLSVCHLDTLWGGT